MPESLSAAENQRAGTHQSETCNQTRIAKTNFARTTALEAMSARTWFREVRFEANTKQTSVRRGSDGFENTMGAPVTYSDRSGFRIGLAIG